MSGSIRIINPILSVILFFSMALFAKGAEQKDSLANIYGKLFDEKGNGWLVLVHGRPTISLITYDKEVPDTVYAFPDYDGSFSFRGIRPAMVTVRASCVGRKTAVQTCEVAAGRNMIYMILYPETETLTEAKVSAEVPLMKKIADTTIFNAAAIRTMDDDNVRAILEQLPGFNVSETSIKVDGEEVKRTYVNGVLIFGDNPLTAANALKADEVTQIKVYDEQSEADKRRGLRHSKKDRVLDIATKEAIFSFSEALAYAVGGADDTGQARYEGIGSIAYYSEMTQLYATGLSNNISVRRGVAIPMSPSNVMLLDNEPKTLSDYKEASKANANFTRYWKDRNYGNRVSATYDFNHDYSKSASQVLTEYFTNGGNTEGVSEENNSSRNMTATHRFTAELDMKDTPMKSVYFKLDGAVSGSGSTSSYMSRTSSGEITDMLRNEISRSESDSYNLSGILSWTNNDAKKVRPGYSLGGGWYYNTNPSWTVDTLQTSYSRRNLVSDAFGRGWNLNSVLSLSSTLVNNGTNTLLLSAALQTSYDRSRRKQLTTDDIDPMSPRVLNLANSYDYSRNDLTNTLSLYLQFNRRQTSLVTGISLSNILRRNDEAWPADNMDESFSKIWDDRNSYFAIAPNIQFSYKTLTLRISSTPSVPSIEQTRNRITDSNPLMLIGGNPDLKASNDFWYECQWYHPLKNRNTSSFSIVVRGNCLVNSIVSKMQYFSETTELSEWDGYTAMPGARLITYENAEGLAGNVSGSIGYSDMFFKRKLNFSTIVSASFVQMPQYVNLSMVELHENIYGIKFSLTFSPIKSFKLFVTPNLSYGKSMTATLDNLSEKINFSLVTNATIRFAKRGKMRLTYSFWDYNYLSGAGVDFESHILSAEISYSFFKRAFEIGLKGNNLLNSGSLYQTIVTATAMTQTWTPTYGRYFLLSLKYHFRAKR